MSILDLRHLFKSEKAAISNLDDYQDYQNEVLDGELSTLII